MSFGNGQNIDFWVKVASFKENTTNELELDMYVVDTLLDQISVLDKKIVGLTQKVERLDEYLMKVIREVKK